MTKNNSYQLQLVKAFRAGEISRQQFIKQFSDWQKTNGMNFDCKGTADKNGTFVTYRGVTAKIENGVLCWKQNKAANLFTFQRQVDYAINAELQSFTNACYYSGKAYDASRANDHEARAGFQQKQNFFIKQAEKWAALWN